MKFKTRPILLIALIILVGYVLPNISWLILTRFTSAPNAYWVGFVSPLFGIGTWVSVEWIAFRGGRTSFATYLVPLLLLCCPLVFQVVMNWAIPDERYVNYFVWHQSKTLILQWMGCYFLSKSFGLLLIRNDCDSADSLEIDRRVSIRFFLVATAIVAAMLAGERWFTPPPMSFPKEHNLFYPLVRLIWPVVESIVLFGVSYSFAATGKQKLVGLGAIGLYLLCAAIWCSYYFIFVYPEMVKTLLSSTPSLRISSISISLPIFSIFLRQLLAVGLLALAGYRFAIIQRIRKVPLHDNASFDSILANERDLSATGQ